MNTTSPPSQPRSFNIVLTGFMGTGKTTVGRVVAGRLGLSFVDTDELIETRHGPIPAIFERDGEAGFRAHERDVTEELANAGGLVIATGGGLMLDPVNAERLGASGRIFCLTADSHEILKRVLEEAGGPDARPRPLLADERPDERIAQLLAARQAVYTEFEQVTTTGRTPSDIADDILARL